MRDLKFRAWNGEEILFADMDRLLDGYKPLDFRIAAQELVFHR